MKKCLISVATLMLVILSTVALVGCVKDDVPSISNNIGQQMPSTNGKNSINDSMTAFDMYSAVYDNYITSSYVASYQTGDVITKTMGVTTSQALEVKKAKSNDTFYMGNYSGTRKEIMGISIKLMEETIIKPQDIRYRSTADCDFGKDGNLVANKWDTPKKYDGLQLLLQDRPNDPTRLFMYIVNESTILNATKPEFDRKTKQYTFTLTLDNTVAPSEYLPVVKQQLESNNFKNPSITFNKLELEFTVWENGLVRAVNVSEAYKFKAGLSASVSLDATINFTYDKAEMNIDKLMKF